MYPNFNYGGFIQSPHTRRTFQFRDMSVLHSKNDGHNQISGAWKCLRRGVYDHLGTTAAKQMQYGSHDNRDYVLRLSVQDNYCCFSYFWI